MDLFKSTKFDPSEYILSIPDLLIHEISKEPRPFDSERADHKIPIKYKDPDVRKKYCSLLLYIENISIIIKIFWL